MNRIGHTWAALAFSPATLSPDALHQPERAALAIAGLLSGAGAPDWLEFRVIPHRTLTHTLSLWLCGALYGLNMMTGYFVELIPDLTYHAALGALLWGFSCGGISHWLGDVLNYKPVPVLTPFDGVALGLFASGDKQAFSTLFVFLVSLALTTIHQL